MNTLIDIQKFLALTESRSIKKSKYQILKMISQQLFIKCNPPVTHCNGRITVVTFV